MSGHNLDRAPTHREKAGQLAAGEPLSGPIVVKLGGSLLDWPPLSHQLPAWLSSLNNVRIIVIAGGGEAANAIRRYDSIHHLGDEAAHWLAIRAMGLSAHLLHAILPHSDVVCDLNECRDCWKASRLPILDPAPMLQRAEQAGRQTPPHAWSATSDSIAAYVAHAWQCESLILLKSTDLPTGGGDALEVACQAGLVDPHFAAAAQNLPEVWLVNLRRQPPQSWPLRRAQSRSVPPAGIPR
jgi:aspartokinase-like uncharacterized kinase